MDVFQIPATISKMTTMSHKSLRLQVDTQENISPEAMSNLMNLLEKLGWFTFNVEVIEADDIKDLPTLDASDYEDGKTPSQRMRSVLYRIWEQKGKQGTFNNYYNNVMEILINKYKDKLD